MYANHFLDRTELKTIGGVMNYRLTKDGQKFIQSRYQISFTD
ncbi:hypothetical protein BTN49_1384 [Candidatus Enterovibrio escicola]|uniref:Uncharacterized protein n=1 Tax=Candidatus Enterovibrio escicola TaxID=1927127 RepID=A0A2A5T3U3_9GAMM|nr:hypothetical protein BTN49_1384 [Candidatus Enterovibrio escacola]